MLRAKPGVPSHISINLSINLIFNYLFNYLFNCLFNCLFIIDLYTYLFIYMPLWISKLMNIFAHWHHLSIHLLLVSGADADGPKLEDRRRRVEGGADGHRSWARSVGSDSQAKGNGRERLR